MESAAHSAAKTREDGLGLPVTNLPNEPIFPPNPNKMKPLAPFLAEPTRRHAHHQNCALANIRQIEYSNIMPNPLRAYQATIFQALAHPTRIAIVEILREGELSAGALQAKLGIEQANLSQHLTILRSRQIVVNRKGGNQVFYSLPNPVLGEVLDIMRHYCQTNLNQAIQTMGELNREAQD
jgi:ArsR family transcriptional regulator